MKELGTDPASVAEFLRSYYLEKEDVPPQVVLHEECEDRELLARWLSEKRGKKVTIIVPQKGDQKKKAQGSR